MNTTILSRPPQAVVPAALNERAPWREAMKSAVRDPDELCRRLRLPASYVPAARRAAEQFPLFVPPGYLARIQPGDPADPLLRQVLPLAEELDPADGFSRDPVGDAAAAVATSGSSSAGLLHKYCGRALMVATGACAVHCRYCFRRHYPYDGIPKGIEAWQPSLDAIAADESIREVILSGGDPLTLVDSQLAELTGQLARIAHLCRLRIHTRLPIVIPERVNDELLRWLTGTRLVPLVVVHANHPRELGADVDEALLRLVRAGVPVLNQSVLLRGVNDSADVLAELCERLIAVRVIPYYLHQLDRVAGAAHFEVPVRQGIELVAQLRARLPGYAVPRYVRETPGGASKELLA